MADSQRTFLQRRARLLFVALIPAGLLSAWALLHDLRIVDDVGLSTSARVAAVGYLALFGWLVHAESSGLQRVLRAWWWLFWTTVLLFCISWLLPLRFVQEDGAIRHIALFSCGSVALRAANWSNLPFPLDRPGVDLVPDWNKWRYETSYGRSNDIESQGVVLRDVFNPDSHRRYIGVALWVPMLLTSLPLPIYISLLMKHRRRQRRALDGLCPECGYDWRATPDQCPECGMRRDGTSSPSHAVP